MDKRVGEGQLRKTIHQVSEKMKICRMTLKIYMEKKINRMIKSEN